MTLVYAHRGASGTLPENTLPAFQRALHAGADGIELDVHATADGIPVVIHDRALDRTTNGAGPVDETSLARLRSFDAGNGARVPTFDEVLNLVEGKVRLDVEIKGSDIEGEVLAVLAAHPAAHWAISSFDWETLRAVRRLAATAVLWPLATECEEALLAIAGDLASPAVALFAGAYTPASAAELRAAGLAVMVWTVNEVAEAERVRDLGAHALCTDYPERIMRAFAGAEPPLSDK